MLFGRKNTVRERIRRVLAVTVAAALPAVIWYVLAQLRVLPWPAASSILGVALGLVGAVIIFFEMLMAPAKWLRGWRIVRVLGSTRAWLRLHVLLGFLVLPVIVIHSGFAFGGPLSAVTMVLFLLVIASGVFGLILQQWLPAKILHDIPGETVASQIETAIVKHRDEAHGIVEAVTGPAAATLSGFYVSQLEPYLLHGRRSGVALASATEAARLFARLRTTLPNTIMNDVSRLEALAELRRQWDRQARINWWLHSWLVVHTPLSVAMAGLMCVHAVLAMKWW